MNTERFWSAVDLARRGPDGAAGPAGGEPADTAPAEVAARLVEVLAAAAPETIVAWDRHLDRVLGASAKVDLWAAAYLINGGCSDEGFDHFRGWLVAQGRRTLAEAVADPDSLAGVPAVRRAASTGAELGCVEMLRAAGAAYHRLTGADLPRPGAGPARPGFDEFWDFDDEDEIRRRLPRLAVLFTEPPEE
ncbi:DUF4240 domain-containing protein [Polymorphospora lycopeni]|uniref:DUF4240 domain-containing protein n=1 Tax=Polymorphospora lycopeni TaxID=3140240 RepID=A0ABV5CW81_9ACTN